MPEHVKPVQEHTVVEQIEQEQVEQIEPANIPDVVDLPETKCKMVPQKRA